MVLIKQNKPDLAWNSLKILKNRFDYRFDEPSLRKPGGFEPLLANPEFRTWLNQG